MRRTFSKHGLEETWDFYQETQGPKTLESMPEAEQTSMLSPLLWLSAQNARAPSQQLPRSAAECHL